MQRTFLRTLALACGIAAATAPAFAQDEGVCRENAYADRPVNPAKSELWQREFINRDQQLMNAIAGDWYFEITASPGGTAMINRQIQTYDPSGSYGYRDQTCAVDNPQLPCSTNQGVGRWAAQPIGDGSFHVARNLSDLNRQDECVGFTARMPDADTMIDAQTGQILLRRMR